MKKSLLALAVLGAFAGAAQAQSAVTIYGSFDGGIRHLSNVNAQGDDRLTMGSNGTFNSNRIGFRGVEDLGGGMNAHFTLETGFNTGTGALDSANLFNRSAFVGLGGSWGSLDLGRQYSVNFKTIGLYDPFSYKYTGIIPLAAQGGLTRLDNDIQYTGTFGPISVRAEYALGEQTSSTSDASTAAIGGSYAAGPFAVGAAYTQGKRLQGAAFQDLTNWTVGGAFSTGAFRVAAGYAQLEQDAAAAITGIAAAADREVKDMWVGASFNASPALQFTGAFYRTNFDQGASEGRRNLIVLGGTYALSKRTNLYFDIDRAKYSGVGRVVALSTPTAPAPGASAVGQNTQTGFSVGVNHLF